MRDGDGEDGKRDGMERARAHSNPEWWRVMLICVREVARRQPYFTTDDVERYRREHYPNHTTHEPRAIGPLMKECAKLEYCRRTGDWFESTQRQCHRRPMMMWWSLIYRGRPPSFRPRRVRNDPRQIELF